MNWGKIAIYIALAIVILIIWKIRRKKGCGPVCRLPKTSPQPKEDPSYSKNLEKIRKRLGRNKEEEKK